MANPTSSTHVYNIAAGLPFAKTLARQLLHDYAHAPDQLNDCLILLPTRRACRILRDAFLQLNDGKPMILPDLQALGDIDEEELSLSVIAGDHTQEFLTLPPVLPPMTRQILLAKAIIAHDDFPHGYDQALRLAKTLGHLMDQIYTEDLDMRDLVSLVPEDFADHWQITLNFLKILSETWPQILDRLGVIDAAARRNILIKTLTAHWHETQPTRRIIAAGTTGSIPATAHLLKVISQLPQGQIVLPGLDLQCDDASWDALPESHPQYGFKHLLQVLEVDRDQVSDWYTPDENSHAPETSRETNSETSSETSRQSTIAARRFIAHEMMRPAHTTKAWQGLSQDQDAQDLCKTALNAFDHYICETPQHEAQIIAAALRETLETPGKTAALITPDRDLAQRVMSACQRWGITIDDSAGIPLTKTPIGVFMLQIIEICAQQLSPIALLSGLKHRFVAKDLRQSLMTLETQILRGFKPPAGIQGLRDLVHAKHEAAQHSGRHIAIDDILGFIDDLDARIAPLLSIFAAGAGDAVPFKALLETHIKTCEALADNPNDLWRGEEGEAASVILAELLSQASHFPDILPQHYADILEQFLAAQTIRPNYGMHPRLQILGQLEARLIDADLVIMGGLNEGSWPPDPGHDPWMSRPMRRSFGLPVAERAIGLAAHDFVQGFCSPHIVITRAKTRDGAPTLPARWLQRLDTVLHACGQSDLQSHQGMLHHWIGVIDTPDVVTPMMRPAPTPPVAARPTRLSITSIETWLKDPYAIYAAHVLKLKPLDDLEKPSDAALRGQILHDTLDDFITQHPQDIPDHAADILYDTAQKCLKDLHQDPEGWAFYWPRFAAISAQFIAKESQWRAEAKPFKTEIKGAMTLNTQAGEFVLYGRADRIDRMHGGYAIIDYKTGGSFAKKALKNGYSPQLPLEGMIVQNGGFDGVQAAPCGYLGYWLLNGAAKHTEEHDTADIITDTQAALIQLVECFADETTPYYAIPRGHARPRFHDYAHLERVEEWAALDDDGDQEAA